MLTSAQRDMIKWMIGVACTVAMILGIAEFPYHEVLGEGRGPASVPPTAPTKPGPLNKQQVLDGKASAHLPLQGKPSGLLEIKIDAPGKGTIEAGSTLDLEATVEALSDAQGLKYIWILPKDGVTVASGPLEGDLGNLAEGEKATIRISLLSSTADNRQVHLHVFKMVNGEAMGKMAQYNTVHQEAIEASLKEKAEILQQSAEITGQSEKVIQ